MFFRVFEKADMPELTGGADDLFLWKVNRSYRNENRPGRKGCCYITRKGHKKPRIPETEASDAIDNRAEWARNHELGEFGVAYGQDPAELAHARSTRDDLIALLKRKEEAGLETVQNFIEKTQAHFKAR